MRSVLPFVLVLIVLLLSNAPPAVAQTDTDSTSATSWYAFPTVYYTPETSLGGGAAGGFFVERNAGRPSSIQGDASVTWNGQYTVNLRPELYRPDGRQRLFGDIAVAQFPTVFYGIGPATTDAMEEDVTTRYVDATVQVEQRVMSGLRLGVRARFRYETVTEVETNGLLARESIPGATGSTVSGLGLVVTRDTRDRAFYPYRGTYATAYAVVHGEWIGSTFDFSRVVLDARQYVPAGRHVVAFQAYAEALAGTAPFSILPQLGGPLRMRGYLEGRFRDDVYATTQGEWRFPLWGRVRGTVFAGAGAVSERLDTFGSDGLEVAGGAGLRYRMNDEGVHIRLDYAVGREGAGLYITAMEPF